MAPRRAPPGHRSPRTVLSLPAHQHTQPRARFWGGGRGSHRSLGCLQQGCVQGPRVGAALGGFGRLLAGAPRSHLYPCLLCNISSSQSSTATARAQGPKRSCLQPPAQLHSWPNPAASPSGSPQRPVQPDSGTGERSRSRPCPCPRSGLLQSPGRHCAESSVAGSAPQIHTIPALEGTDSHASQVMF